MTAASSTDGPLTGRIGMVIGASSGIGRAPAVALVAAGARIVIADLDAAASANPEIADAVVWL